MSFYGSSPLGSRFQSVLKTFGEDPDQQFLNAFPEERLAQMAQEEGISFGTVFTPAITLWALVLQACSSCKSCVAAVARVAHLMAVLKLGEISSNDGGYCKARQKLSLRFLQRISREMASEVEDQAPEDWRWHGHRVLLVDGTTINMPDTPKNQEAYPQSSQQKPGLGFPQMRLVVLIALATAVILDAADGPCIGKETGEPALLRQLLGSLRTNDVVLGDRFYCSYWMIALLQNHGVNVVARLHQMRSANFDGDGNSFSGDVVQVWAKPDRPDWMDEEVYASIPDTLTIRLVRVLVTEPGYRTQKLVVATTLLDTEKYTSNDIAILYQRRWNVEVDIRSIKTTMKMEEFRCKTPEMVRKELWSHILAYNAVRRIMAAAALQSGVKPRQLSWAGALQILEAYRNELQRVRPGSAQWTELIGRILRAIGSRRVGNRPGRVEPRRTKRRQQKYSPLQQPRGEARASLLEGAAQD